MINRCELHFASILKNVGHMVLCLLEFVGGQHITEEERSDLKLIFSELLYNAVIHGNNKDETKYVHVIVEATDYEIAASVRDEGPGFDYNQVIAYAHSEEAVLSEHGRGMVLVCALTDKLCFSEGGNQISFVKTLKK